MRPLQGIEITLPMTQQNPPKLANTVVKRHELESRSESQVAAKYA